MAQSALRAYRQQRAAMEDYGVPQFTDREAAALEMLRNPRMLPVEPSLGDKFVWAVGDMLGGKSDDYLTRRRADRLARSIDTAREFIDPLWVLRKTIDEQDIARKEGDPGNPVVDAVEVALAAGVGPAKKIAPAVRRAEKFVATIGDTPLAGAPTSANIPGFGRVRLGASPEATRAAEQYAQSSGIPYSPLTGYVPADPERGARIAREYDLMEHAPRDRDVKRAYNKMIDETLGQYESMLSQGIEPYFITGEDPYKASPYLALLDIERNKRLGVFPTRDGFGTSADFDPKGNPLLKETEFQISGQPALANDIFRAVHDYYGHYKPGAGFRASGEETAFQSHSGMYSPEARRAMGSETRGQNSWLNFGPYGETNRTAGIDETIFADQKTGLMPRWAVEEGSATAIDRLNRFNSAVRQRSTGLEGSINPDGSISLIHYSYRPLERVDPKFYGTGMSGNTTSEMNRANSKDFVKRWYAGVESTINGYKKERGLGPYKNEIRVPGELIYDARRDPEGLWRTGKVNKSEKNIADKNYSGYYYDHPELGVVAVMFDPFDIAKKYVFPLAAGAVGISAATEQESPAEGGM